VYVLEWDGLGQAKRKVVALDLEMGGSELQVAVLVESRKRPAGREEGGGEEEGCVQCIGGLKKGVGGGDGGGEWKKRRREGGGGGGGGGGRGDGHGGVIRGRSEGVLSFGFGSDDCETLTFGLKSCCDGVGYGVSAAKQEKEEEGEEKDAEGWGGRDLLGNMDFFCALL
jgi:hypothetical protein